MAAGSTYSPIVSVTVDSPTGGYTFYNIPQTYTDIVMVVNGVSSGTNINYGIRFNEDAGTNYSSLRMYGNGTSASADILPNFTNSITSNLSGNQSTVIHNFMNYSNSTLRKTFLVRSTSNALIWANVGLWRSTAAITTIQFVTTTGYALQSGTTLTLFGIKAA